MNAFRWATEDRTRFWQLVMLAAFIAVNGLIAIAALPDASIRFAADNLNYVSPAKGMLAYGEFVRMDRPGIPETFSSPLYPVLLAGHFMLFDDRTAFGVMVFLQLGMLFATGVLARRIIAPYVPKAALFAQAFVVFNPNAIGNAHLIQTDTLFTLLVIIAVYFLLDYGRTFRLRTLILCGLVCAVAAYCRPAGLYMVLVVPIAAGLLIWRRSPESVSWRQVGHGLLGGGAAVLLVSILVSPWVYRNYAVTGVPAFTTNTGYYVRDNVLQVMARANNQSINQAATDFRAKVDVYLRTQGVASRDELNDAEIRKATGTVAFQVLSELPMIDVVSVGIRSQLELYLGGGAGNIKEILGVEGEGMHVLEHFDGVGGAWSSIPAFLSSVPLPYFAMVVVALGWAFVGRCLGLVGLGTLLRSPHWRVGLTIVFLLVYFSAIYGWLGTSRFRLPMEPMLAILAGVGLQRLLSIRTRSSSEAP